MRKTHLECLGIDDRTIRNLIFKNCVGRGMDWIDLSQNRQSWQAFVNAVMSLQFP